ncbi:hypothetical protein TrVFT333_006864 [Trichoderma virens FT-333]|nr:hypothetical protein TrVFT333_006864 [Trichoderma virens FT-333]
MAAEAAVGLIHVGGLQQLVRLVGPRRASENPLAAAQVSASEEARVGWVDSVHLTANSLLKDVDNVAARIALFPVETLRATLPRLVLLNKLLLGRPLKMILLDPMS